MHPRMKPQIKDAFPRYWRHGQELAWEVDYDLAGVSFALTVPYARDKAEAFRKAAELLRL